MGVRQCGATMIDKRLMGKMSRRHGKKFELKVRHDLESKGWIVCKWSNNVEFSDNSGADSEPTSNEYKGKLIPAKHTFNLFTKAMSAGNGFPDFIAFRYCPDAGENGYPMRDSFPLIKGEEGFEEYTEGYARHIVIGVESKMSGKLDKIEKEKCEWLLKNNVFSKILIASKKDKGIEYTEFSNM